MLLKAIAVLATSLLLQACGTSWPLLQTVQEAQRVDPVVVQWDRSINSNGKRDCRVAPDIAKPGDRPGDSGTTVKRKILSDILCPIDLDTWAFPHDQYNTEQKGQRVMPAYAKITACFERYVEPVNLKDVQDALESLKRQNATNNNAITGLNAEIASQNTALAVLNGSLATEKKALQAETVKAADKQNAKIIADATKRVAELEKQVAVLDKKAKENAALLQMREEIDRPRLQYHITHYTNIKAALLATQKSAVAPKNPVAALFPIPADANVCRAMRNLLQDEILTRSEEMCRKHISDVGATNSVINADLGLATLIGSTLGAVVTGDVLQRTFSAAASVSAGTQSLISREIYRDYVAPAISKAILAQREKKLIEIRLEQAKNLADYTPARAIQDTIDYHESCSFSNGLILLTASAEKRAVPSQDQVRKQIDDLYEQLAKLETSSKATDGRSISVQEEDQLQKTRLKLRRQIDAQQERLRLIQSM